MLLISACTYAHLQQLRAQLYVELDGIDTPRRTKMPSISCLVHVAQRVPLIPRERPGTRARVPICVHLCTYRCSFRCIAKWRLETFSARRNPRESLSRATRLHKGDCSRFSYYNATTSLAAYDLHPSRASATSSDWFYELTAPPPFSPCLKSIIDFKCKPAFVAHAFAKVQRERMYVLYKFNSHFLVSW
jgi:hypothetical protein